MKEKIIVFLFIGYIAIFSMLHIILKDNEISKTERRKLESFPQFELTSDYIKEIDEYLLDHFPFRDNFRSIKANFNYKVLQKLDNNDIYLKDNYIFKSLYPTNNKSVENFKNNINKISDLLTENNNKYIMIIPDKNYYLDTNNFLQIDYNYIYDEINKLNIKDIDIRNIMKLNDYYETDTHWKQENLDKVIYEMSKIMNFNYINYSYTKNIYNNFYGVYYGESAINRNPENLYYLTNEITNNAQVKYLENNTLNSVYNVNKLKGLDAYEVYLDGASSFIEINNIYNNSSKELVVFRDSFGSSIIPLLIPYYSKIIVIDNRYINSENFMKYIQFNNQDVLFLYSTLLVNDSGSLKG